MQLSLLSCVVFCMITISILTYPVLLLQILSHNKNGLKLLAGCSEIVRVNCGYTIKVHICLEVKSKFMYLYVFIKKCKQTSAFKQTKCIVVLSILLCRSVHPPHHRGRTWRSPRLMAGGRRGGSGGCGLLVISCIPGLVWAERLAAARMRLIRSVYLNTSIFCSSLLPHFPLSK